MLRTKAAHLVKLAAAATDPLRAADGLVVLIYHRVGGGSASAVDLARSVFTEQMEELAATSEVVSLDSGLDLLGTGARPPGRGRVVITFDDGTRDFAEEAFPVLERLGLPVTLYVATDFVERAQPFPPAAPPLSWPALADTLGSGLVTVGSHTHTHALLDRLDADRVGDELDRSIALIEDRLGVTPRHFAYPKALLGSPGAQAAVRARFASAAVAGTRPNRYGCADPYRLHRSPVQVGDGMRWFRRKAAGGMALEDDLRRVVNRRRYREAIT
jgi:peptidoglycan/xylan/chitin deacetylase (PgdA/CDA1 family)